MILLSLSLSFSSKWNHFVKHQSAFQVSPPPQLDERKPRTEHTYVLGSVTQLIQQRGVISRFVRWTRFCPLLKSIRVQFCFLIIVDPRRVTSSTQKCTLERGITQRWGGKHFFIYRDRVGVARFKWVFIREK